MIWRLTTLAVLKDCPELTRRNTFVDPVVFCLWEGGQPDIHIPLVHLLISLPDICHAFCYRKPATVSVWSLGKSCHDVSPTCLTGTGITPILLHRVRSGNSQLHSTGKSLSHCGHFWKAIASLTTRSTLIGPITICGLTKFRMVRIRPRLQSFSVDRISSLTRHGRANISSGVSIA